MVVPENVYSAAVNGELDVLREYFASGDRDPNDALERNGWTLLDGACFGKTEGTRGRRIISCEVISFLGAGTRYRQPAPDAVRASRRARVAYHAAPPRRLQARALFLAVEARLVVVLPVLGSGISLV